MADILPFKTRDERRQQALEDIRTESEVLTATELYNKLIQESYETLDFLITKYKQTGKWNPTANTLMRRAFDSINAVCASLAGVKQHGTQEKAGTGQPLIIRNVGDKPVTLDRPTVANLFVGRTSNTSNTGSTSSNGSDRHDPA